MREEKKLNKVIMQDGIDTQSEILEELKRRYPQYVEQLDKKQAQIKKRRFAVIASLATIVACVAIVLPCAVLLPNKDNSGSNSGRENIRYCTQDEYSMHDVEFTIGEYRENNNGIFLYFDWYEFCEDRKTVCYISDSDNEVLCIEENMYNPQSDEVIQLSITKVNIYLSAFDTTIDWCKSEQLVSNHAVKWTVTEWNAICIFEDSGYRYFIQIKQGQDENRLFELVKELLEKN